MRKGILTILIITGFWNSIFSQNDNVELITYENIEQNYSILYPKGWNLKTNTEKITSIESTKFSGGIYVSLYEGINFSDDLMIPFILESNVLPSEFEQNILNTQENGIKTWIVSYTNSHNNLTCISMYKKKEDNLWFVSTEIDPSLWKNGWSEIIIKVLDSFEVK